MVLQLTQITIISSGNGHVAITFEGRNIEPGAQLLVDGQLVVASGQMKAGGYTFVVKWGKQPTPKSLGLQNPGGMVVLSRIWSWITEKTGNPGNDKGNHGNGGGNDHGNGNGDGGGSGNGNGGDKGKQGEPPIRKESGAIGTEYPPLN